MVAWYLSCSNSYLVRKIYVCRAFFVVFSRRVMTLEESGFVMKSNSLVPVGGCRQLISLTTCGLNVLYIPKEELHFWLTTPSKISDGWMMELVQKPLFLPSFFDTDTYLLVISLFLNPVMVSRHHERRDILEFMKPWRQLHQF